MRLTSRQKSGPTSAVVQLVRADPFPLRIQVVRKQGNRLERFIATKLKSIRGMRDYKVVARQLASNFQMLQAGGWRTYLDIANSIRLSNDQPNERVAVKSIQDAFKGFGPKQSRNFLQALGLTRYEIPLDSRFMKWLRDELRFPLPISGTVLADTTYYEFVLDHIQALCADADEYPCMLDAAVFSDVDDDSWQPEMMDF